MQDRLPAPHDLSTFERCKLDWREHERHVTVRRLHEDLLDLRRSDAAFGLQRAGGLDGAVLAPEAFVLQFTGPGQADERLLIVNLGPDLPMPSLAEPLMAPPRDHVWAVRWSSEHPDYGGVGTGSFDEQDWQIPGHAALVLKPVPATEQRHGSDRSHPG
jgi:maltooligosyltrehalose trehalohydrolase